MAKRALVSDNDFFFVAFLAELLEDRGYEVTKAYDGKEKIFRLTVSIGIGQYTHAEDLSPMVLLKRANEALYRAKEEGRNRVCGFWILD
jgi:diguanylate cyclase (GGDEF)-like protein